MNFRRKSAQPEKKEGKGPDLGIFSHKFYSAIRDNKIIVFVHMFNSTDDVMYCT